MAPRVLQHFLTVLLLFLGYAAGCRGDGNKGSAITYPVQDGLTFYEHETVNVSWTSKFKSAILLVFCWEGANENAITMSKSR